jgi:hypothetical protein
MVDDGGRKAILTYYEVSEGKFSGQYMADIAGNG